VENYRRSVAAGSTGGRADKKVIIITGAAQGFGEGIGRCLIPEGANIVVADLNEERAGRRQQISTGLRKIIRLFS